MGVAEKVRRQRKCETKKVEGGEMSGKFKTRRPIAVGPAVHVDSDRPAGPA
jgi:uncharacterized protein YmfQ (DUF2313 family)